MRTKQNKAARKTGWIQNGPQQIAQHCPAQNQRTWLVNRSQLLVKFLNAKSSNIYSFHYINVIIELLSCDSF